MTETGKTKVFVSSVQKELENERLAVSELIASDPFLNRHVEAILFEMLPASAASAETAYLEALRACRMYLGIIGFHYGRKGDDGLSATHREYLEARRIDIPTFFFVKGDSSRDQERDTDLKAFFATIRDETQGHVYKRFSHYQSLKTRVREVLLAELQKQGETPSSKEIEIAEQTIAQTADFDSRLMEQADFEDLDPEQCRKWVAACTGVPETGVDSADIRKTLLNRGMVWHSEENGTDHPTAAGLLLLGKNPEAYFPQVRIAANAFGGIERGEPIDRDEIRAALPVSVERAFQFLKRNMRHTTRIEGFAKVELHEYPYEALREAVVNAVAHRDYDLAGSSIRIDKYADRIEVISPGLPPAPITLRKIERLDYIACSRNPRLARGLSFFERIEEQGDGLRRMVRLSEALGLRRPEFQFKDGHFKVTFFAPEDMHALKSQGVQPIFEVPGNLLENLNNTQRAIIRHLMAHPAVKVPELAKAFGLTPQAIRKAIKPLTDAGLVIQEGKARGTTYSLRERAG